MEKLNKLILFFVPFIVVCKAYNPLTQEISNLDNYSITESAHFCPEIINEFKDFENLIPQTIIDETIAEHFITDKSFRNALKYLESYEFKQLQKQLLNVPEIINILEYLHLTIENATTRNTGAAKITTIAGVKASLDDYNDDAAVDSDDKADTVTTTAGTTISKRNSMLTTKTAKEALNKKKVSKRPQQQFHIEEDTSKNFEIDDSASNANSVHIVLLEDLEVKAKIHNRGHNKHRQYNNHYSSQLGTFTTFVNEVLQHLPHSAFQNMIKKKCNKNVKFAEFYQALRKDELKSIVEKAKLTDNIKKIIQTLGSHDVDINSLQPIAFKVISWGPDVLFIN